MGILNVTPDSFSDGGAFDRVGKAVERGVAMLEEGAAIVDVGGESTRPGFTPVSAEEEMERVVPVIEELRSRCEGAFLSIDTSKPEVAEAALQAGCDIVNDVWGFQQDGSMAEVVAAHQAGVVLMRNGRLAEEKGGLIDSILQSWQRSLSFALQAGIDRDQIVFDPGIGFGTTREEDLIILQNLGTLREFGFPVLLGASRKRITAEPKGISLSDRLEATLATTGVGIAAGVELFRVHDVAENRRFADMADLLQGEEKL